MSIDKHLNIHKELQALEERAKIWANAVDATLSALKRVHNADHLPKTKGDHSAPYPDNPSDPLAKLISEMTASFTGSGAEEGWSKPLRLKFEAVAHFVTACMNWSELYRIEKEQGATESHLEFIEMQIRTTLSNAKANFDEWEQGVKPKLKSAWESWENLKN